MYVNLSDLGCFFISFLKANIFISRSKFFYIFIYLFHYQFSIPAMNILMMSWTKRN